LYSHSTLVCEIYLYVILCIHLLVYCPKIVTHTYSRTAGHTTGKPQGYGRGRPAAGTPADLDSEPPAYQSTREPIPTRRTVDDKDESEIELEEEMEIIRKMEYEAQIEANKKLGKTQLQTPNNFLNPPPSNNQQTSPNFAYPPPPLYMPQNPFAYPQSQNVYQPPPSLLPPPQYPVVTNQNPQHVAPQPPQTQFAGSTFLGTSQTPRFVSQQPQQVPIQNNRDTKFVKWTNKYDSKKLPLTLYIRYFESHAQLNQYTDTQMTDQLLNSLGMDAPRILTKLTSPYTYRDLITAVYNYYEPPAQKHSLQIRLRHMQRTDKQTAREFSNDIQDLVHKAHSDMPQLLQDDTALQQFIYGQNDSATSMLLTHNPATLDDAVNFLTVIEANAEAKRIQGSLQPGSALSKASYNEPPTSQSVQTPSNPNSKSPPQATPAGSVETFHTEEADRTQYSDDIDDIVNAAICSLSLCDSPNEDDDEDVNIFEILSSRIRRKFPRANNSRKCYYCGKAGHMWMKCFRLLKILQDNGYTTPQRNSRRSQPYPKPKQTTSQPKKRTQRSKSRQRTRFANVVENEEVDSDNKDEEEEDNLNA